MAASDEFETELDAYREQVERPLWRLFRTHTPDHVIWLTVGLYANLWGVQAGEIESLPEKFLVRATERSGDHRT